MEIPVEAQIRLNKFKPRDYQMPIFKAFFVDKFRRLVVVMARRCIYSESFISMANGSVKKIKDIKVGDKILSFDGKNVVPDTVKNVWFTGRKEAVEIVSNKYPHLITSRDHMFFSKGKWIRAEDLITDSERKKELVQVGFKIKKKAASLRDLQLAEFLGYMTHDGYVVGYQQPKFTNNNIDILDRVAFLAKELFGYNGVLRKKGNGYDLGLTNGTKGGGTFKNKVKELFRSVGLDIQKSKMTIHPLVWKMSEEEILVYLRAVVSSDGSIEVKKVRRVVLSGVSREIKPTCEISISCGKSKQLAIDTYWLLRKIGVIPQKVQLDKVSNWKVRFSGYDSVNKILSGIVYGKEEARKLALDTITPRKTRHGRKYKNSVMNVVTTHRIKESATCDMYDIETNKNHNFFANGYLAHNSGKDLCAWNIVIREAITKPGVYYMVYPTYSQGRKILWDSVTICGKRFLDYVPEQLIESMNSQEMRIHLYNGSIIQVLGSDNPDRVVGTNPCGVVFSEYALQNPMIYSLMSPILAANKGWAIFISTPRGKNAFWDLYQLALNSPYWWCCKLGLNETRHIDPEEIEKEVRDGNMSPDLIQQEYYVSFEAGVEGSYYCKYVDKMRLNNQIGSVPWESGFKVHTAWDIGVRDSTSIIFFQVIGQTVRIIDHYEKNKEGLEHYCKYVLAKDYAYGMHIAPHDIKVKEFGSGMTRIDKARQLGIEFTVSTNVSIMDGIEAVRSALSRIWIDEDKCSDLIRSIENYRQEYDTKTQTYKAKPLHCKHSHNCDALRYLCVSLPKTRDGLSADDLSRIRNEALYGKKSNLPPGFR